jgi:hypothetical protein
MIRFQKKSRAVELEQSDVFRHSPPHPPLRGGLSPKGEAKFRIGQAATGAVDHSGA